MGTANRVLAPSNISMTRHVAFAHRRHCCSDRGIIGSIQQRLVDIELVAFGIGQSDRVVVEALLDDRVQARRTEGHEPRRLSFDPLASGSPDRRPPEADHPLTGITSMSAGPKACLRREDAASGILTGCPRESRRCAGG
jgi:hypothetical protein